MLFCGAGGPSGSGKTSLAHKMANIIGCEVVSLENYYKSEHVKDYKYDDFSSLDISLLSKVRTSWLMSTYVELGWIFDIRLWNGLQNDVKNDINRSVLGRWCIIKEFVSQNNVNWCISRIGILFPGTGVGLPFHKWNGLFVS